MHKPVLEARVCANSRVTLTNVDAFIRISVTPPCPVSSHEHAETYSGLCKHTLSVLRRAKSDACINKKYTTSLKPF